MDISSWSVAPLFFCVLFVTFTLHTHSVDVDDVDVDVVVVFA